MCEFVSYIEKKENNHQKVFFLTYAQMHDERGEAIQKRFPGKGEMLGHTAIRAYYEFEGGVELEQTDFTTPANFPAVIVNAIKRGDMRGLATPDRLLSGPADAECRKICDPAYAEYLKIRDLAWAEFRKIGGSAFWDLFANPENRNPLWR